jgi:entericidin B
MCAVNGRKSIHSILKGETDMGNSKKLVCLALAILTMAIGVIGCNTLAGAGKDIEKTGENIQKAAD